MPTQHRPRLAVEPDGHADDRDAIARLVADVQDAFNAKDPERGVEHFAADASAVDVRGRLVEGFDALLEAHRAGFAGPLRDQFARYDVADVAFLRPDVALARVLATATDRDGTPISVGHAMVATYVLVREDGRWWIAARQNVLAAG
jgi:uncharacterized protein (TIGR02246 family)